MNRDKDEKYLDLLLEIIQSTFLDILNDSHSWFISYESNIYE